MKCVGEYDKSKPSLVFPYYNILTHTLKHTDHSFSELRKKIHTMSDSSLTINPKTLSDLLAISVFDHFKETFWFRLPFLNKKLNEIFLSGLSKWFFLLK